MEYSVEALAKLSGVSVRTLHYYDEIGLLTPLARMASGRRCYGTQQFLRLQEILYWKEVGFSLKKIQGVLESKEVSRIKALSIQKEVLLKEITRLENLTKSIDRTINHYKGDTMSEQAIHDQFQNFQNRQKGYSDVYEKHFGKEVIDKYVSNFQNWSMEEKVAYIANSKELVNKVIAAIKSSVEPSSEEAQVLMQEEFDLANSFMPMTKEAYEQQRDSLLLKADFLDDLHPDLRGFLYQAKSVFAKNHFCD